MFVWTGKTWGVRWKRHIVQIPPWSHVSTSDTTRELKTTSNPWSMTTSIGPISDGVFKTVCEVSSGTIYTYTNPKSRETILQIKSTGQYTDMWDFHEGLANVQQRRKNPTDKDNFGYYRGFIDKKWKLVIPCQFSQAGNFSEWKVWVYYDWTYWVIDRQGKKLFDIILGDTVLKWFEIIGMGALGFQEWMCRIVVRNTDTESVDRIMFVDSKGVIFERPRYLEVLEATDFAWGLSKVKLRNGEWWLLDKFGQFYEIWNIQ